VDIWAFGVLLYTMISGSPPFVAENDLDILSLVKEGKYDFTPAGLWDGISSDTKDLISKCLTVDEVQRPDFWRVMSEPAMTSAEADGAVYEASQTLGRASVSKDKSAMNPVKSVKAAFSMMAELMTDSQVTELRNHFRDLDDDDTGMIELQDSVEKLRSMVQDNPEAKDLLKLLDTGGICGRVNYLMYMATMTDRRRQLRREAARVIFNLLDGDKTGKIILSKIAQALEKDDGLEDISKSTAKPKGSEVQKVWIEMKKVFSMTEGQKQLPDRELSFDTFFRELPNSTHDSVF
jgi:serine/threonine protein kinase